jgi:peptide/nickel transport system ATP-binding protein
MNTKLTPTGPVSKAPVSAADPVLAVRGLRTVFEQDGGEALVAVDGVDLALARGEVLGLVGESGSGKSVTGFSLLGLVEPPGRIAAGSVRLAGRELVGLPEHALRKLRGREIALIFQDPMMTLNPVLRVGTQMTEVLAAHGMAHGAAAREEAARWLAAMGVAEPGSRLRGSTPGRTSSPAVCGSEWRSPPRS